MGIHKLKANNPSADCTRVLLLFLSFFFLLFINNVHGNEDINISADHMEHLSRDNVLIAAGSVIITMDDATLRGDNISYDRNTNIAVASGNVIFEDEEIIVTAEKIEINLKSKKGSMHKGYIFYKEQNIHIRGNKINKTGEKTFRIDKASITSCDAVTPAWQVSASDITVDQNDRLKGWHGTMRVNDTPLLYSPYVYAPLNRERHTGLMFPTFGYSKTRGSFYKQGLFWAIKDNQDATFYLDHYDELGLAQGVDYRYIISPEINGEFWVYHSEDEQRDRDLYEFKGYHNHKFSHDVSGYLKVHAVSHSDYYEIMDSTSLRRFGLESWTTEPFGITAQENLQKYLESDLQIAKTFYGGRTYLLGQVRQGLEDSSEETPQSIPEIALILNTRSKKNFSWNLSLKGTNFMREKGQEGFRLDFNPNFYLSYGRLFNITQKIGLRETSYLLSNPSKNEARFLFDSSTALTTRLFRKYDNFIHIIEPSIEYEYIPSVDHDDIPFFDSVDSINQTSRINYALTNRLSGLKNYNLQTRFRLSQSYSLLNVEKRFSPLLAEAIFYNNYVSLTMNASYDVHDNKISENFASIMFSRKKYYIGMGKNFREATNVSQYYIQTGLISPINVLDISIPIDLNATITYDVNGHGVQSVNVGSTYHHQCWGLSLNYNKTTIEYQILLAIELKGVGSFSLGPF
jgi:LPS-assembly protein